MLHQLCGDIVYATKVSLNTSVKIIIDNVDQKTSSFNSLSTMRNWCTYCFFYLSYHHAVPTFWQFYDTKTRFCYMSSNMTTATKMRFFYTETSCSLATKLMSKVTRFHCNKYRVCCFKNVNSNYQHNITAKANRALFMLLSSNCLQDNISRR